MSLILDALKRAERERQAPPSAALGDVASPGSGRRSQGSRWKLVAGVTLLLIVAVGAWKMLSHKRTNAAPAVAQVVKPMQTHTPTPAPAPTQQPAPTQTAPSSSPAPGQSGLPPMLASPPPEAQPEVIPGTEGVASLDELAEGEPEPGPAPQPQAAPATKSPPAGATQAQPAPQAETEPSEETPAPTEQAPAPAQAPAPKPQGKAQAKPAPAPQQREIPPALTQPAQYRKFREMPPEYRADFPALTIEVHVYEEKPSQRFVIVNGRRYHQGDTMAEGPQIVEIARDGIVLDYRSERLLYPISR